MYDDHIAMTSLFLCNLCFFFSFFFFNVFGLASVTVALLWDTDMGINDSLWFNSDSNFGCSPDSMTATSTEIRTETAMAFYFLHTDVKLWMFKKKKKQSESPHCELHAKVTPYGCSMKRSLLWPCQSSTLCSRSQAFSGTAWLHTTSRI